MRVLVCGSRNWSNKLLIKQELQSIDNISVIIHGAARGADYLAGQVAIELGIPVQEFPADWNTHGLSAGPKRNQQMLDEGNPDYVLAFNNDLENSKGTRDMVRRADKAGIKFKIITENLCSK